MYVTGFSGGSLVKNLPADSGDRGDVGSQKMWVSSLGQEDPLEEEMAAHSSILACKISWAEELRRLQSMGLQRVSSSGLCFFFFLFCFGFFSLTVFFFKF